MILGIYLSYLSLVFFSLSLNKHYNQMFSKELNKNLKNVIKILAAILLICAYLIFIDKLGLSIGILYFLGILSILNIIIAFIYSYKLTILIKLSFFLILFFIFTYI